MERPGKHSPLLVNMTIYSCPKTLKNSNKEHKNNLYIMFLIIILGHTARREVEMA